MRKALDYILAIVKSFIWLFIFLVIQEAAMAQSVAFYALYNKKFIDIISNPKYSADGITLSEASQYTDSVLEYMMLVSLFWFILMYILDTQLVHREDTKNLKISKVKFKYIPKFISIGIVTNILVSVLLFLITWKFPEAAKYAVHMSKYGGPISMIICVGVLAPLCEEIVFRYFIYNSARKNTSAIFAVLLSSVLFGISHNNLIQSSYACIFGLIFCTYNIKYKSILPGIIIHSSINLVTVILSVEQAGKIGEVVLTMLALLAATIPAIIIELRERLNTKHELHI